MRLVAMGDSITAGQYCHIAWPQFLHGFDEVLNKGVSNETTRQMLERFPADVQNHHPDVVVIQAGHNDCNRWATDRGLPRVSPAAFRANLVEMFDRARAFGATPFVCTIVPTAKSAEYDDDALVYSAHVWEAAADRNVRVADVRTAFAHNPDWRTRLLLEDGLHLTEEGHKVYAKTVQRLVNP